MLTRRAPGRQEPGRAPRNEALTANAVAACATIHLNCSRDGTLQSYGLCATSTGCTMAMGPASSMQKVLCTYLKKGCCVSARITVDSSLCSDPAQCSDTLCTSSTHVTGAQHSERQWSAGILACTP